MATYKVNKGDTLWKIAQMHGTTVAELASANNISNPDMIYIGQSITIPEKAPAKTCINNSILDYQAMLDTYKDRPDSAQPSLH